jgi:hypothetical protein
MEPSALIALLIGVAFVAFLLLWWRSSGASSSRDQAREEELEPLLRRNPRALNDIIYNPKGYRKPRK